MMSRKSLEHPRWSLKHPRVLVSHFCGKYFLHIFMILATRNSELLQLPQGRSRKPDNRIRCYNIRKMRLHLTQHVKILRQKVNLQLSRYPENRREKVCVSPKFVGANLAKTCIRITFKTCRISFTSQHRRNRCDKLRPTPNWRPAVNRQPGFPRGVLVKLPIHT